LILNKDLFVPERMLRMMGLFDQKIIQHVTQMNTYKEPRYPQLYSGMINKQQMTVHCSVTRPVQFLSGNISSAAAFTDKRGMGWNINNIKRFFNLPEKMRQIKMMKRQKKERTTTRKKRQSGILKS
jgi:hypothetical protein